MADGLNDDGESLVCDWFYSTRGGETLMAHKSLMQSLLCQCLQQSSSLFQYFKAIYRQSPPLSSDWITLEHLKQILKAIAKAGVKAICVVDAMDESEDEAKSEQQRRLVLRYFSSLVSEVPKSRMKFLILSRPYPDIEQHFSEHRFTYPNIHSVILERENGPAIAKIVDSGIRSLQQTMHPLKRPERALSVTQAHYPGSDERLSPNFGRRHLQKRRKGEEEEQCEKIRDYLLSNANGVILWVALVFATLKTMVEGVYTLKGLLKAATSLPTDLIALYRHIILGLIAKHDDTQLYLARKALMWVSGANARASLTIAELHEALAVPDEINQELFAEEDPIKDGKIHCSDWNEFRYRLRILCGPLLEVIKAPERAVEDDLADEDEVDSSDIVQLLHRTVKDVLANPREADKLGFQDSDAQALVERTLENYGLLVLPSDHSTVASFKTRVQKRVSRLDCDIFGVSGIVNYLDQRTLMPFALRAFPRWPFNRGSSSRSNTEYVASILVDEVASFHSGPASDTGMTYDPYPHGRAYSGPPERAYWGPPERAQGMTHTNYLYLGGPFRDSPGRAYSEGMMHDSPRRVAICSEYTRYACDGGLITAIIILLQLFSVLVQDRDNNSDFFGEVVHVLLVLARKHDLIHLAEKLELMSQYKPRSCQAGSENKVLQRIRVYNTKSLNNDDASPISDIEEAISRVTDFVKQRTPIYLRMKALFDSGGPLKVIIWNDMVGRILRLRHGSSGTSQKPVEVDVWEAVLRAMAQHKKKGPQAGKLTARALEEILEGFTRTREIVLRYSRSVLKLMLVKD